jgi:hypothetical protein
MCYVLSVMCIVMCCVLCVYTYLSSVYVVECECGCVRQEGVCAVGEEEAHQVGLGVHLCVCVCVCVCLCVCVCVCVFVCGGRFWSVENKL